MGNGSECPTASNYAAHDFAVIASRAITSMLKSGASASSWLVRDWRNIRFHKLKRKPMNFDRDCSAWCAMVRLGLAPRWQRIAGVR